MSKIQYEKDVESMDDIKDAIFESLTAGIEVMKKGELPHMTLSFELMGMKVVCDVKPSEKSQ